MPDDRQTLPEQGNSPQVELPTAPPMWTIPHGFVPPGDPDKRGCVKCGMNADHPCHADGRRS